MNNNIVIAYFIIPIILGISLILFAGKIYAFVDKIHGRINKKVCKKLEIEERDLPMFLRVGVKPAFGTWGIRIIGVLLLVFLSYRLFINPLWD
jgi:hypothetical protein